MKLDRVVWPGFNPDPFKNRSTRHSSQINYVKRELKMKQSEELQKSGAENGQQPGRVDEKDSPLEKLIDVHSKALDDLVNVNSLFTIAVFIGLSFASPKQHSLENRPECDADPVVAKTLVTYEVISFACFLVSSLAAKSLKVLLNFYKIRDYIELVGIPDKCLRKIILSSTWRHTLFMVSALASACGIIFLTLSMVNVVQIRLGKLSCGSVYTLKSVISLTVLVSAALVLLYVPPVIFAFFARMKENSDKKQSNTV